VADRLLIGLLHLDIKYGRNAENRAARRIDTAPLRVKRFLDRVDMEALLRR
jgi:hypothetical protein